MFARRTTCRSASASTLSTSQLRQYKDRLEKNVSVEIKPSRFVSKNSMAAAKLCPVNLPVFTPAACRAALSAADQLMAFHRNALQFILIWRARDSPNLISAQQGAREVICRRKIYGMLEKVSGSLSEWTRYAAQTPSRLRHGRGRPERALYQRAKRFRKRYRTFGTRSWPARWMSRKRLRAPSASSARAP